MFALPCAIAMGVACKSDKASEGNAPQASASPTPSGAGASPKPAPTSEVSKGNALKPAPRSPDDPPDSELSTEEDFAEQAEKEITESTDLESALSELQAEIEK